MGVVLVPDDFVVGTVGNYPLILPILDPERVDELILELF